jgi:hypothetical protein
VTDRELLEFIAAQVETPTITVEELKGQVDRLVDWADSLVCQSRRKVAVNSTEKCR